MLEPPLYPEHFPQCLAQSTFSGHDWQIHERPSKGTGRRDFQLFPLSSPSLRQSWCYRRFRASLFGRTLPKMHSSRIVVGRVSEHLFISLLSSERLSTSGDQLADSQRRGDVGNNSWSVRIQGNESFGRKPGGNWRLRREHFLGLAISPFHVGDNFWFQWLAIVGASG